MPAPLPADLPAPDAADAADSAALSGRIAAAIDAAGGWLPFDAYMELALYSPALGYYAAPRSRFGERGDFVTAPELSPRFGACVARSVAAVLDPLDGGTVFEVGAGSGALAESLLGALSSRDDFTYCILERSASGRAAQAERLKGFGDRVRWEDDFPGVGFRGVLLANELLDAIPARRFEVGEHGPVELGVRREGAGFAWALAGHPGEPWPDSLVEAVSSHARGCRGESGPARDAWVREAAARFEAGALLLFDYGYPRAELHHPQRVDGTLACHYRHRVHADPFLWPGLCDISVHVDFTGVAEAATGAGMDFAGYTSQAHYLIDAGLLEGMDDPALGDRERAQRSAEVQRLILPAEMGEAVKAIAFTRGIEIALPGFRGHPLRL